MPEGQIRYVSYGVCPKCGSEIVRLPEVTITVCDCQSVGEVLLKPAILVRSLIAIPVEVVEKKILEELRKYKILGGSKQ